MREDNGYLCVYSQGMKENVGNESFQNILEFQGPSLLPCILKEGKISSTRYSVGLALPQIAILPTRKFLFT